MRERAALYFALGVASTITIGAITDRMAIGNDGLHFPDGTVQTSAAAERRSFYLSTVGVQGDSVKTACAAGYHAASLWEILDPTTLRYNKTLGFNRDDSGFGPPTNRFGWVRTGYDSWTEQEPGQSNCGNWSTTAGHGTIIYLPYFDWDRLGALQYAPWGGATSSCSSSLGVWCVED